ncbi:hypothetical protein [Photobacterium sp. R1]
MSILQINHSTLTHFDGGFNDNINNVGWYSGIFFNLKNTSDTTITINELEFNIGEILFSEVLFNAVDSVYDTFTLELRELDVELPIVLGPGIEHRFSGNITRIKAVNNQEIYGSPATGSYGVFVNSTTLNYTQENSSHISGNVVS